MPPDNPSVGFADSSLYTREPSRHPARCHSERCPGDGNVSHYAATVDAVPASPPRGSFSVVHRCGIVGRIAIIRKASGKTPSWATQRLPCAKGAVGEAD